MLQMFHFVSLKILTFRYESVFSNRPLNLIQMSKLYGLLTNCNNRKSAFGRKNKT